MYVFLQWAQVAWALLLLVCGWRVLKRAGVTAIAAPFVWVICGYGIVCPLSGLIRRAESDYVATSVINDAEYLRAVLWWCVSEAVALVGYLGGILAAHRAGARSLVQAEVAQLVRLKTPYLIACVALTVLFFANPYRMVDFGVLSATSAAELATGGLMIGGLVLMLLSGIVVPLVCARPIVGGALFFVCLLLMATGGSKGIAAVFFVVASSQFASVREVLRSRDRPHARTAWGKRILLVVLLVSLAALLMNIAVRHRLGDSQISVFQSAQASLIRFTQHDVAAVMHANVAWREWASSEYVKNQLLSFVPGFIWSEKPINFAYEINRLMGRNFSAASPSIYGSVFLAVNSFLYWPVLAIVCVLFGRFQGWVSWQRGQSFTLQTGWYSFYTSAMLFEGNWVITTVQVLALFGWRVILGRERNSAPTPINGTFGGHNLRGAVVKPRKQSHV